MKFLRLIALALNLICICLLAVASFAIVKTALGAPAQPASVILTLLALGATGPAITAAYLYRTQIQGAGKTWAEVVGEIAPFTVTKKEG